jgi:hypothetical protein
MLDDFSSPFREVREGFEACEDGFGKESVVAKGVDTENEGCDKSLENVTSFLSPGYWGIYLCQCELLTASKERRCVLQEWLDLLPNDVNELLR